MTISFLRSPSQGDDQQSNNRRSDDSEIPNNTVNVSNTQSQETDSLGNARSQANPETKDESQTQSGTLASGD
ncbi:MAG: hypothetical protein AAF939_18430, partial [Planctomycetota bacterium]